MRKLLTICVLAALTFSLLLSGCDNKKNDNEPTPTPSEQPSPSPTPEESPTATPDETPDESGNPGGVDEQSAFAQLGNILVAANELIPGGNGMVMSFESDVTADTASGLGLTDEQFEQYVDEAHLSTAAISTSAHEIAIFKCKDADSAKEVKKLIAENFDAGKWICVQPEKCAVVESDEYVLLVVSTDTVVEAVLEAYKNNTGDSLGDVDEFFARS